MIRLRTNLRSVGLGFVTYLAAVAVLSAAALAAPALVSTWRPDPPAIDGLTADWPALGTLDRGLDVGAANDGEFLYLVASTKDPEILDLVAAGLVVWLDAGGRRAQTFGLRIAGVEQPPLPGMNPVAPRTPAPGVTATTVHDRFDVLGPGRNQRRLVDLTPELGIAVASGDADSQVFYELKVPLQKGGTRIYAVGAGPGRTIGLGIATPQAPQNLARRQRLVGSSGWIGGNPFYGGGFAPFREPDGRPKPLEIWTTVALASKAP
jgi:hypothetical protein